MVIAYILHAVLFKDNVNLVLLLAICFANFRRKVNIIIFT